MNWKLWIIVATMGIGALGNFKDLWSPRTVVRDEDEVRRIALVALMFQAFILYAVLSSF
jgi:hypothetical protein